MKTTNYIILLFCIIFTTNTFSQGQFWRINGNNGITINDYLGTNNNAHLIFAPTTPKGCVLPLRAACRAGRAAKPPACVALPSGLIPLPPVITHKLLAATPLQAATAPLLQELL